MYVHTRRTFVGSLVLGAAAFSTPGLFAETLAQTVRTGEGPFYPDKMPLDTDNDLLIVNDSITPAVGDITHLTGRVLSKSGEPIRNAFVEIWQVDSKASYIHTDGANTGGRDGNFQGYGRFLSDSRGQYYFRTIKPVSYTLQNQFRTAHIHFAISKNGRRIFTTQMHVKGHPDNARDFILNGMKAAAAETVLIDFKKAQGSKTAELSANFDIVMGYTAAELENGSLKAASANPKGFAHADNPFSSAGLRSGIRPSKASHVMHKRNWNSALNRRDWMMAAGGVLLAARATAQSKLLPLNSSGLDHLSITLPDSAAAATFYGKIFDPQVFHERTGVQRYYVRLGSAYLAFGPQANATPYIDHIAAGVIDFVEDDFGKPEIKNQITAAGLAAPPGVLPMLSDPDNLRLQLVNTTHGLFDTLMPVGA